MKNNKFMLVVFLLVIIGWFWLWFAKVKNSTIQDPLKIRIFASSNITTSHIVQFFDLEDVYYVEELIIKHNNVTRDDFGRFWFTILEIDLNSIYSLLSNYNQSNRIFVGLLNVCITHESNTILMFQVMNSKDKSLNNMHMVATGHLNLIIIHSCGFDFDCTQHYNSYDINSPASKQLDSYTTCFDIPI